MTILWCSRHAMTEQQYRDLHIDEEVVSVNLTYPADAYEAAAMILAGADDLGAKTITGVFPAHVAIALIDLIRERKDGETELVVPVSEPAKAVEGEVRGNGFVHSHWEYFS